MRELAGRLIGNPQLPSHYRVIGPILLFLQGEFAALEVFRELADGDGAWLSGLAHFFLAEIAQNRGALDETAGHLEVALTRFRESGDRWGQASVLPMRAQLRRYDDLDGALADLDEARTLAAGFGSLNIGDQLFTDLRWIDVYRRRGDTGRALSLLDSTRERAVHASSMEMLLLVDAWEAGIRVRLNDLDRARSLIDSAGRALRTDTAFPTGEARTMVAAARAALALALDDLPGAKASLHEAYTAALATRELPVLALVAVPAAALAAAGGEWHESAVLLGAAARLRGTHDRTDPGVRELTARGESRLGQDVFGAAYAAGWHLDAEAAVVAVDPSAGCEGAEKQI